MKNIDKIMKNLITIIFLIFIFGMCADYCINVVKDVTDNVQVNEKTEYVQEFIGLKEKAMAKHIPEDKAKQDRSKKNKLLDFYRTKTNALTNYNDLALKDFFLNLNANFCKKTGMSYIPGTTFLKQEDGTLITISSDNQNVDEAQLKIQIDYLDNFKKSLDEKGINCLYVNCPNKERLQIDRLPIGFNNNFERKENNCVENLLGESGIPVLDLTKEMIKNDADIQAMFYKTDHHWKTNYGIDAAKYISAYLNSEYNYKIDTGIFEKSNYDLKRYEKCLLGSTGVNSTASFTTADDLEVFVPKAENEFSFEIPSKNIDLDGDFNIFVNKEKLENEKLWPFSAYGSYIYGNSAYLKIENKTIEDDHKILIVKDSFANVIVPYLSQVVSRIDVVDLRKSQTDHYNGSIIKLIEENNYDTVLFIYSSFSYEQDRLYLK